MRRLTLGLLCATYLCLSLIVARRLWVAGHGLPTVARREGAEDSFAVRMTTRRGAEVVLQQTAASWTPGVVGVTVVAGTDGCTTIMLGALAMSVIAWKSFSGSKETLAIISTPVPWLATVPSTSV